MLYVINDGRYTIDESTQCLSFAKSSSRFWLNDPISSRLVPAIETLVWKSSHFLSISGKKRQLDSALATFPRVKGIRDSDPVSSVKGRAYQSSAHGVDGQSDR